MKAEKGRALAALVLGGIFLGSSPILVRVSELGPIATAFWRLTLASLGVEAHLSQASADGTAAAAARLLRRERIGGMLKFYYRAAA
jgi:hypothetical protein